MNSKLKTNRVIAFDFDETIAHSFPLLAATYTRSFKELGIDGINRDNLKTLWGPDEMGIFIKLVGKDKAPEAFKRYCQIYDECHEEYMGKIDPQIKSLLLDLKKAGVRLAMLTGRGLEPTLISFRHFGIEGVFEKMYMGSHEGTNKSVNMLKALADFQVGPADFLYVGDAYSDWTEGQKAGIKVLSALYFNKAEAGKLEKDNAGNTCLTVGELREKVFAFLGE